MNRLQKFISNLPLELIFNSGKFFATRLIGLAIGFIFSWWIGREFGATFWGDFTLYNTLLHIFIIPCVIGLDSLTVKYTAQFYALSEMQEFSEFYKSTISLTIIGSIITFVLSYVLLNSDLIDLSFIGDIESKGINKVLICLPGMAIFTIHQSILRGQKNMFVYGILKNILIFGILFLISFTFYNIKKTNFNIYLLLDIYIFTIYILAIITGIFLFVNSGLRYKFSLRNIGLLRESYPLMIVSSMALIVTYTDVLMISFYLPNSEVGIYDIAIKFSALSGIFLMAINSYAMPKFAEYFGSGNRNALKTIVQQTSKLIFWSSIPFLIFGILFSSSLLGLYGEEFLSGTMALIILVIGQFISSICGSVAYLLQMTDNQVLFQRIFLIATVINIAFNIILIPIYGITGAAIASLLSTAFWNITSVFFVKRKLDILTLYIPFSKSVK